MSDREPRFRHTAIGASAGAGKTHQLTSRFIALLDADEPPDHILATTFTRKAAGEILERILQRLAAAAVDPELCQKLAEQIGNRLLAPARACELVGRLARQLHRLHARTLDSFFARIARSFAIELDLSPDWQIINESTDAMLRGEAIHATLRDCDPRALVEMVRQVSRGDASRSVADRIRRLVSDQHGLFCETDAAAWQRIQRPARRKQADIDAAIGSLEQADVPSTKKGTENQNWRKAVVSAIEQARGKVWDKFVESGLVTAAMAGGEYYREPVPTAIRESLKPLIAEARAVLVGRIADRCEASYRLLDEFDSRYRRLQRLQRGLRFEDVTRSLARSAMIRNYREIYYRLDADVRHLLLDEFQDTSLVQWEVVRPIFDEIVSFADDSHSFFCVGDVKQAIYGWRGGIAEIFDTLHSGPHELTWEPLNKSQRSAQPIIDVVNGVFGQINKNAALAGYPAAATAWRAKFKHHETARTDLPGYVCLSVAPRLEASGDEDEETLVCAANEVERIAARAPGRSIGVLVRKNKMIPRLIYELRRRGLKVSEEGGNVLTDTPAVTVLLSLLKLADHPGDTAARFHVATSPLGRLVGLTSHDDDAAASRVAAGVRGSLLADGYGPTLWNWVKQLAGAGACDRRDLERLGQLVELAHRYEPDATLRPAHFVAFVEATPVEDPVPANVRVLTIHKAKGLQFDVVVLPDLDGDLIEKRPTFLTDRPEPTARINRVCPYVSKSLQRLLPDDLQQLFVEWETKAVADELCVLYVALTRAIHAMHMIVAPSREKENGLPTTFAGIIRAGLTPGGRLESGVTAYEHGNAAWYAPAGRRPAPPPAMLPAPEIPAAAGAPDSSGLIVQVAASPPHAVRGLGRESPSSLEGGRHVDLRTRLRLGTTAALDRGSLFHAWFELIGWLGDGEPDEAALREAARTAALRCENLDEQIREFRGMLRQPAIRDSLMRPAASAARSTELWRERPFVIRWDDALLAGKFDRVVITRDGSRVVGAEVLDFKTDTIPTDDPGRATVLTEHYRPQVDAYRKAVARLTGTDASRVSGRLLFVTTGLVKEL